MSLRKKKSSHEKGRSVTGTYQVSKGLEDVKGMEIVDVSGS
jgi:hypothetical protein